jgi:hypothetical protein
LGYHFSGVGEQHWGQSWLVCLFGKGQHFILESGDLLLSSGEDYLGTVQDSELNDGYPSENQIPELKVLEPGEIRHDRNQRVTVYKQGDRVKNIGDAKNDPAGAISFIYPKSYIRKHDQNY